MIPSELAKLTPSARKAVLKLEKDYKADEDEVRPGRQRVAANIELSLVGRLLDVTSRSWVTAKELLVSYQERMVVHGEMILKACKAPAPLSSDSACYTAAVHRHMAIVADNYTHRASDLTMVISRTRTAMRRHYEVLQDEYAVEHAIEVQCKDWKTYVKEWRQVANGEPVEKAAFALAK